MAQGSYFKGWSSTQPTVSTTSGYNQTKETWIGQVLDVDYTDEPGKVKVRLFGQSAQYDDNEIETYAYPADLNILKYPIPGETVLVVQGLRNQTAKGRFILDYYYVSTISSNQNLTYNGDPYIGQAVPTRLADRIFTPEHEHRFENKLKSKESLLSGDATLKAKAPLRPYEGDFILQGRFGASIRLGSTGESKSNPWSEKGGQSGNPIMIISANKTDNPSPAIEDVNSNNSTMYLCSSQVLPVKMATSRGLLTYSYKYNVKSIDTGDADITQFLSTTAHPLVDNYSIMGGSGEDLSGISDGNAPGGSSGGGGGNIQVGSVTNTGGNLLGAGGTGTVTAGAGQTVVVDSPWKSVRSGTYALNVVNSGGVPVITSPVNSYGKRDAVRIITLHDTSGNDHPPLDTALGVAKRGSGIHWVVNGDGALARGDGGNELNQMIHGDDFNTYGMGIEVQTYGGLKYNETRKAFYNEYDEVWPLKKSHNKFNKDIVDLGFFYNGHRYFIDYTDAQIASLTRIILATMQKYPKIKQAIQGKPVYQTVFGLPEYPTYDGIYKSMNAPYKSNTVSEYGIFAHARSNGTHTDGTPTPRYVKMLMGFGYTGPLLPAKGYWKTSGATVIGL